MTPDLHRASDAPSTEDEASLLRQVSELDRRAFELLYRVYYRRLKRFLTQVTRRPQLVDEIVNDTMLVVWRKAATFNHVSRVSTWIFAIAYRKALKALKRAAELPPTPWDGESGSADGPETELIARESRNRLRHALSGLSAEQRAVVELTYFHGYAYREVAQIVGCPVDTVKTRMFHARRKLKILLDGNREDPS
jgi:RNA polymerase sigma factor (sigma-70 family)